MIVTNGVDGLGDYTDMITEQNVDGSVEILGEKHKKGRRRESQRRGTGPSLSVFFLSCVFFF